MFELSEAFNALTLRNACILFILEKFDQLSVMPWYVLDFSILNYIIFMGSMDGESSWTSFYVIYLVCELVKHVIQLEVKISKNDIYELIKNVDFLLYVYLCDVISYAGIHIWFNVYYLKLVVTL